MHEQYLPTGNEWVSLPTLQGPYRGAGVLFLPTHGV